MTITIKQQKALLNPLDRAAEILFGVIMATTFTCSMSVGSSHQVEMSELLIGTIGCNLAWGFVDAIMYLVETMAHRNRNRVMFHAMRIANSEEARKIVSEALPQVVAEAIDEKELELIRQKLLELPSTAGKRQLTTRDFKKSLAIFLTSFIATFPIVIPFIFIEDSIVALRTSNGVGIVLMFMCGWSVSKYVGFNKWVGSISMAVVGTLLVVVTIMLGG
jgi:VIT1/CCC1 family predicted Fe2+/Mn2+ transporter